MELEKGKDKQTVKDMAVGASITKPSVAAAEAAMSEAVRVKWAAAQGQLPKDDAQDLAEADVEGCEEEEGGEDDPVEE